MVDFYLKRGDRSQPLQRVLRDFDGDPKDLITKTVKFYMTNARTGAVVVNGVVITPVDAVNGIVQYEWEAGTTDVAGTYLGEFETIDPEGRKESFPNDRNLEILITKKVGDP